MKVTGQGVVCCLLPQSIATLPSYSQLQHFEVIQCCSREYYGDSPIGHNNQPITPCMSAPTGVSFMNCHKPKQSCNANKTLCKIISILLVDILHPLIARSVQFANGSLPPPWITECANLSPLLNSLHHFSFNQVPDYIFSMYWLSCF